MRAESAWAETWWTTDAPSLRVATRDGRYIAIWSAGSGAQPIIVVADHGRQRCEKILPYLGHWATLHAVEPESCFGPAAVVLAADAVGTRYAIAVGKHAASWVREAKGGVPNLTAVLVDAEPTPDADPDFAYSTQGDPLVVANVIVEFFGLTR